MLKADSGPGRGALKLLTCLCHLGFYLYPGVPNTTAISQETDINYGPFKSQFRRNLEEVVDERVLQVKSTSLQPWMAPLVVFGGKDEETGLVINQDESAFEVGFFVMHVRKHGQRLVWHHTRRHVLPTQRSIESWVMLTME